MEMIDILKKHPIIPVLVLRDIKDALSIAEALMIGGIETIEVTLRTPVALEIIQALREKFPKLIVGAGTILKADQMIKAKEAGAQFGVSPGFTVELAAIAKEIDLPYLPGALTPSEIMVAKEMGYQCLKFFPAEYSGGIDMLKAFKSVFPEITFCPTGGVNRSNFKDYLALDNVMSVGGSWLVTPNEVKEKDWGVITMMVKESLASL